VKRCVSISCSLFHGADDRIGGVLYAQRQLYVNPETVSGIGGLILT